MIDDFGKFNSNFFVIEFGDKIGTFAGEVFKLNFGEMMKEGIE